jgi:hypothetical protein
MTTFSTHTILVLTKPPGGARPAQPRPSAQPGPFVAPFYAPLPHSHSLPLFCRQLLSGGFHLWPMRLFALQGKNCAATRFFFWRPCPPSRRVFCFRVCALYIASLASRCACTTLYIHTIHTHIVKNSHKVLKLKMRRKRTILIGSSGGLTTAAPLLIGLGSALSRVSTQHTKAAPIAHTTFIYTIHDAKSNT